MKRLAAALFLVLALLSATAFAAETSATVAGFGGDVTAN